MRKAGWARRAGWGAGGLLVAALCAAPSTPVPAAVALPAWLAGAWTREAGGRTMDEVWLAPRGGMMLASARTAGADQVYEFEFLRIVQRAGSLVFIAQPNGAPPTEFALAAHGPDSVRFENPAHDFPQAIVYRNGGADRMEAIVSGPGRAGTRVLRLEYRRAGGSAAP